MSQSRKLKIYRKHQSRDWKYVSVPEIRLEGKWLQKLGFDIGKEIEIKQQKKKLTITVIDQNKENQKPTKQLEN